MAIISSIIKAARNTTQYGVVNQDKSCNFCETVSSYDPGEQKTCIQSSRQDFNPTAKNGNFQLNGCQDQKVTPDGVLTDCRSRSRNDSRAAQSFDSGFGSINEWATDFSARGSQNGAGNSHSQDGRRTPYYRAKSLEDGWVLLDVKMVDEGARMSSLSHCPFSR